MGCLRNRWWCGNGGGGSNNGGRVEVPGGVWQSGCTINTGDNARLIVACSSPDDFAK